MENTWRSSSTTQREARRNVSLDTEGEFPAWLAETFIHNGPGQVEVSDTPLAGAGSAPERGDLRPLVVG
jgi:carotenoid cleavage dioxygenase-like enzyme